MTEEEKMIRGMIYDSSDKVLAMKCTNAHKLSKVITIHMKMKWKKERRY